MKIMAFLQNMWFKDPETAKRVFAAHPERRNDLIRIYLFMGCLTGHRLQQVFGEDLCHEIIWEECSPLIGGKSAAAFPADVEHMTTAIRAARPDVILAFGKTASTALRYIKMRPEFSKPYIIHGPHPAARKNAIQGLRAMKSALEQLVASQKDKSVSIPNQGKLA